MANCIFNGFENVTGTICKHVGRYRGKKVVTRVVAQVRNGKQKVYIRQDTERKTPLSQNEITARIRFAEASQYCRLLSQEKRDEYMRQGKKTGFKYGCKKYNTLRGYIMARFYKNDLC
jgi:hypothetical protein